MDKQKDFDKDINVRSKMIEEITELMGNWALRNNMCWHEGHAKALAETFIENDYGKTPENAVVLTREEYEWLTCCFGKFEEIMNDIKEQSRKETAEKFAERLKEQFADSARLCEQVDEICKEFTEGNNGACKP